MMFGAILLVWGTMALVGVALLGEAGERELYWRTKCKEARLAQDKAEALAAVRLKRLKSLMKKGTKK